MPQCGSQIILCDVPIRYDTYTGCSHLCQYCFVQKKNGDVFGKIGNGEGVEMLRNFIEGKRNNVTKWCDWDIPLHWGGMSDPFQPIERERHNSLKALEVFHETQYPFIVSTKNKMIAEEPYLSLIKECNCVVQFSACCPSYDAMEKGASTFAERMEAAAKIAPFKRVNIRCQPYMPQYFDEVMKAIDTFHEVGAHGCIFEGIKFQKKMPGTFKLQGDSVYPSKLYKQHFMHFKMKLHQLGMKFYCGENRLRGMSDELCCCGIEGLGWKPNTANLNHFLYDRENFKFSPSQQQPDTASPFLVIAQFAVSRYMAAYPYEKMMRLATQDKGFIKVLVEDGIVK